MKKRKKRKEKKSKRPVKEKHKNVIVTTEGWRKL